SGAVAYYSLALDSYWHADWLGTTTRLISTPSRTVKGGKAFAPFGDQYAIGGTFAGAPLFTGAGSTNALPGVYTFPAREYEPTEGRWLTPDPAGVAAVDLTDPQTWNRYVYVRNNPLGLVDPTGTSYKTIQVQVCTPFINSSIFYEPISGQPGGGSTSQCHYESYTYWVDDDDDGVSNGAVGDSGPSSTGGNPGGSGTPPKSGTTTTTPWYKNPCIKGAIGNGLLHVGIDSLGLIPEAGGVAREIGHQFLYRGVVADQFGARVIRNVGFGAGLGSTILGLQDTSTTGLASTTLGAAGIVAAFARTAPIVGQAISVVSIGVDLYTAGKAIAACSN
ncbi:MAG: hypothetical protein JO061_15765, partial [Acidobacteriaceae bacterium]|nr:hypothetical protein [Acidobacteriaceae bacterium]